MTGPRATTSTVALLGDWRGWPATIAGLWRRSLRFRTIAVTVLATSSAVLVICLTMALSIQNDLFESRRDEALEDAQRTVAAAQGLVDAADVGEDRTAQRALMNSVWTEIARLSSAERFAAFRVEGVATDAAPPGVTAGGLTSEMLSSGLRKTVVSLSDRQAWQSITLPGDGGRDLPGVVVGQQLFVPDVGAYEVYIAYDMEDANETLLFVQRALWFAGFALLAIIAGILWIVLRSVARPIIQVSETSARLASGDLAVRIDVHGEDEIATLGRSFNVMADSIEAQIQELGELSLVQQRFVSDVSHELRTPLTTIRLAADMLNDHRADFDPVPARTTELLHTQVQRFETLLSDLLEISRYDAGSVQLELDATSLAQLAEDIIDQMRPLADSRGSELRLVAPGGYSPVDMDPRRVRRVLRNLIGNAIEHGEGRPIVVTVDSDQRAVAAGVRDFGLGMKPEDAERVFDRFWRADPSRQRTIGGTGLGLSIALGDARLHGGTLEVWSELGVGTNFVLTIPRSEEPLDGSSPVPTEPQHTLTDVGGATEPIPLAELQRELFDKDGGLR